MNCVLFGKIVIDLARGRVLEAGARQDGLAHAEACRACALLLAEQQILSIDLRTYREDSEQRSLAPARLEADLQAAFRAHHHHLAASETISQQPRERAWVWRRPFAAIAATAVAAVVTLAVLVPRVDRQTPPQTSVSTTPPPLRASAPAMIGDGQAGAEIAANDVRDSQQALARPAPAPARKTKRAAVSRKDTAPVASQTVASARPAETRAEEIATDFFALGESTRQSPLDGGQIVRVAVPRSTLASFGLPVNMDREGEAVQAELLLGHDGVARAIRFVK